MEIGKPVDSIHQSSPLSKIDFPWFSNHLGQQITRISMGSQEQIEEVWENTIATSRLMLADLQYQESSGLWLRAQKYAGQARTIIRLENSNWWMDAITVCFKQFKKRNHPPVGKSATSLFLWISKSLRDLVVYRWTIHRISLGVPQLWYPRHQPLPAQYAGGVLAHTSPSRSCSATGTNDSIAQNPEDVLVTRISVTLDINHRWLQYGMLHVNINK